MFNCYFYNTIHDAKLKHKNQYISYLKVMNCYLIVIFVA
jgi:hypothetical protein